MKPQRLAVESSPPYDQRAIVKTLGRLSGAGVARPGALGVDVRQGLGRHSARVCAVPERHHRGRRRARRDGQQDRLAVDAGRERAAGLKHGRTWRYARLAQAAGKRMARHLSDKGYAFFHQTGTRFMVARKFIPSVSRPGQLRDRLLLAGLRGLRRVLGR